MNTPPTASGEYLPPRRTILFNTLTTPRFVLCWLAIWMSAMLTCDYYVRIEGPAMKARIFTHHSMISGSAPYQYRYRVLTPYVAEGIGRLIQKLPIVRTRADAPFLAYSELAFKLAYCAINLLALVVFLWCLGELVWKLFSYELALFATAATGLVVSFTFRDHYYQPWSFWEGAFFALGLLLIHQQRYLLLSVVSLFALVNRETSVFLLVAFLFTALPGEASKSALRSALRKRDLRFALADLALWVLGFFLLHYVVGYRPSTFFVETAIIGNRAHVWEALLLNGLVVGVVSPLVIKGVRRSPPLIQRAAFMMPAYFALLLIIGYWWEIRYWITMLPIVIPALVAAVASREQAHPA